MNLQAGKSQRSVPEHTATAQLSHSKAGTLLSVCGNQLLPSLEIIITIIQWWGLCCVTDVSAVFIRGWNCVSGKPWNNHIAEQENCKLPPPSSPSCLSQITVNNANCFSLPFSQPATDYCKIATVFVDLLWKKCLPLGNYSCCCLLVLVCCVLFSFLF